MQGVATLLITSVMAWGCGDDASADAEKPTDGVATSETGTEAGTGSSGTTGGGSPASTGQAGSTETSAGADESDGDASTDSSTGGDGTTGGPPEGSLPMFVALGQGARTTVSCDDGQSWVLDNNVVDDNDDHGPYSSRGLAYGDGTFIAAVGWGNPGSLRVSVDGADWEETFPFVDRRGMAIVPSGMIGVAFGAGLFVAVEGDTPWISDDGGLTWTIGEDVPNTDNLRVVGYSGFGGGRFYAAGDAEQLFVSSDGGETWQAPNSVDGVCSGGNLTRRGGVVGNDELFVVVTDTGNACRTDDGGETFSVHAVSPGEASSVVSGDVVWTGEQFYASSAGRGFFSPDAITWTEVEYNLPDASVRKLAFSPDTGTYVGVERDGETFYRSPDGVQWTQLPDDAAQVGTDITQLVYGYGTPSPQCPVGS